VCVCVCVCSTENPSYNGADCTKKDLNSSSGTAPSDARAAPGSRREVTSPRPQVLAAMSTALASGEELR
jgi:hypothetical protein